MELAKDIGKLIGSMIIAFGIIFAFGLVIYTAKYGICIPPVGEK
jgi:hypothetical protein